VEERVTHGKFPFIEVELKFGVIIFPNSVWQKLLDGHDPLTHWISVVLGVHRYQHILVKILPMACCLLHSIIFV
jgi:hypothetical protein